MIYSIDEARTLAQRRLPRIMFDYIDGAAGDERSKGRNQGALDAIQLLPRVLINVTQRRLAKTLLGREWGLPFGIAPMGMCDLAWPRTDRALAAAAVKHNIPVTLSTMASSSIEQMRQWAGENAWFQLYVGQSGELADEFVDRAGDAGYSVLMLTVDVPHPAPRRRDMRNGFRVPFRIGPRQFVDFATHPRWSIGSLLAGPPDLANVITSRSGQTIDRQANRGFIDWEYLARLRQQWPGTLIIKGVMAPADAQRVQEAGADAIYVSNHGGRQLDSAPPPVALLPQIRATVGPDYPLLFDSGVRNGEGIVKALALGADFVMLGRPFLYGMGAAGADGVNRVIEILRDEIDMTLAQLGRVDIADVDNSVVYGMCGL